MSLFNDANAFMKNRTLNVLEKTEFLDPAHPATREKLIAFLRAEYENATLIEIERAIDQTTELLEPPFTKAVFLKKIRSKLED